MSALESLLTRRVVIVTGKGGVGKTSVSLAIGLLAARRGLRTIVCETSGADQVCGRFGLPSAGYSLTALAPELYTISIRPEAAIEEYLLRMLRFRKLYEMVFKNRIMGPFIDAVPGLHDLVQLGKVFDLERERLPGAAGGLGARRRAWDLIILDAPATGHGINMLTAPRGMMRLTRAGPFHDNARDVATLLEDPARTAIVLASLPEELPLAETTELFGRLGTYQSQVAGIVLNAVSATTLPGEYGDLRSTLLGSANEAGAEAVRLADALLRRHTTEQRAHATLARLGVPVIDFPDVETASVERPELERLATCLGAYT